jgi:hypothetical protein
LACTSSRGVTIGVSVGASLRVTSGRSTTYTGVVGAIAEPDFIPANTYSFGLFTYVYRDPASGREVEILDYWVE